MQVSHEEWVSMWNDYAKNPEKALEWQNRYMNFMFDLEDSSGKQMQAFPMHIFNSNRNRTENLTFTFRVTRLTCGPAGRASDKHNDKLLTLRANVDPTGP